MASTSAIEGEDELAGISEEGVEETVRCGRPSLLIGYG